jgi:hypothetical protein
MLKWAFHFKKGFKPMEYKYHLEIRPQIKIGFCFMPGKYFEIELLCFTFRMLFGEDCEGFHFWKG